MRTRKSPEVNCRLSYFPSFFPYHHVIGEKCELFSRVLFSHSGNGKTHGHISTIYGSLSCDFNCLLEIKTVVKLSVQRNQELFVISEYAFSAVLQRLFPVIIPSSIERNIHVSCGSLSNKLEAIADISRRKVNHN